MYVYIHRCIHQYKTESGIGNVYAHVCIDLCVYIYINLCTYKYRTGSYIYSTGSVFEGDHSITAKTNLAPLLPCTDHSVLCGVGVIMCTVYGREGAMCARLVCAVIQITLLPHRLVWYTWYTSPVYSTQDYSNTVQYTMEQPPSPRAPYTL